MKSQKKFIITCGRMSVASPCVRNCCLDKKDVCLGCGRTVEEIVRWGDVDDAEKRKILAAAEKRQRGKREYEK